MWPTLIGTSDSDPSTCSIAALSVLRPFSNIQWQVLSILFRVCSSSLRTLAWRCVSTVVPMAMISFFLWSIVDKGNSQEIGYKPKGFWDTCTVSTDTDKLFVSCTFQDNQQCNRRTGGKASRGFRLHISQWYHEHMHSWTSHWVSSIIFRA